MKPASWLKQLFLPAKSEIPKRIILPVEEQIEAWHIASKKMKWNIGREEFDNIGTPPLLTANGIDKRFIGVTLFYGFGNDGSGYADSVLSGRLAWDYASKHRQHKVWQSPHINFDKPDSFRIRPEAPPRPRGFYFATMQIGERFKRMSVSKSRKYFNSITGCGPEGFQFLCVTHVNVSYMMSERKIPFMVLADYDVAPYGFNDFFDAPQLFSSNKILGLGIGNVDKDYPGFGIPTLHF